MRLQAAINIIDAQVNKVAKELEARIAHLTNAQDARGQAKAIRSRWALLRRRLLK